MLSGAFFQRTMASFMAGGALMFPIAIVAFAIWMVYVWGYMRLRHIRRQTEISALELDELASFFEYLRGLVAVAPLLGLLGTVLGMIETFQALVYGGVEMTTRLADGIHVALYTTQAGLFSALPGLVALTHLGHIYRGIYKKHYGTGVPR